MSPVSGSLKLRSYGGYKNYLQGTLTFRGKVWRREKNLISDVDWLWTRIGCGVGVGSSQ